MNAPTPDTLLEQLFRLRKEHKEALKKLKIVTAGDLLRYLPNRYTDPHELYTVQSAPIGTGVSIAGRILKIEAGKTWQSKTPTQEEVEDTLEQYAELAQNPVVVH